MTLPWHAQFVPSWLHGQLYKLNEHISRVALCGDRLKDQDRIYRLLSSAFSGLDGYCASNAEAASIDAVSGEAASQNGEVTVDGARLILEALLETDQQGPSQGAVVLDLGSGVGRFVAAVAVLEGAGRVDRCIGVELCPSRHARAQIARDRLRSSAGNGDERSRFARMEVCLGDMLRAHDAISACSHVYIASLLFSTETMEKLAELFEAAPHLCAVATLQDFPQSAPWSFIWDGRVVRARMDWHEDWHSGGSDVLIYRRPYRSAARPTSRATS